jgi:2-polyprenyl-3-methyl-5-hydroxy-6-metoxy-1,4-benzoquinol methylase
MERIPEPELMDEPEQALAYANADFSEPHQFFVECFQRVFPGLNVTGKVLDLGCGPGDISIRFARAHPACTIHGIDGAEAMLEQGRRLIEQHRLQSRIELYRARLPAETAPLGHYDAIISNSLLHHLHDPGVMWNAIKQYSAPGSPLLVMDLQRPADRLQARHLVEQYAASEPEVLQRDFYHSLCAAFTPTEVLRQLHHAGLEYLTVESVSDRHLIVYGMLNQPGG